MAIAGVYLRGFHGGSSYRRASRTLPGPVGHGVPVDREEILAVSERASVPGPSRLEVLGEVPGQPRRVGLVPGSFDPMSVAHEALADAVQADLVVLVWSPATLPKEAAAAGPVEPPLLEPEVRIEALLAFTAGRDHQVVAVASHGRYADQAEAAATAFPEAEIEVGIGSDKLAQILDPTWYDDRDAALGRLFTVADVAYAVRAGEEELAERALAEAPLWAPRFRRIALPSDVADVSGRAIRTRLRRGEDVSSLIPPEIRPSL